MALLEIRNLSVSFPTSSGMFKAVEGVDLTLNAGDILGVVGESGSGKSVTMMAIMGLLPSSASVDAKVMTFDGHDLRSLGGRQRRKIIGKDVAMIFQEPMSSLNPCFTIGFQITEALKTHLGGSRKDHRNRAIKLLDEVGIPSPETRLSNFPHQLSGGMSQRVMIAMAISCNPRFLIADEPTTALDVTIQAQILDLLVGLQRDHGMALVLITHDMGVVAEMAERVIVMYAGQPAEEQSATALFSEPRHPYTAALLSALPERSFHERRLATIPGVVPGAHDRPHGCVFSPRCSSAQTRCHSERPAYEPLGEGTKVRCFYPLDLPLETAT